MYTDLLQSLGLAQNEARIYETLLKHGELSVSDIAVRAQVHRRNAYDSLARLLEKGLVFEVIVPRESHYAAVGPAKLLDMVEQKRTALQKVLPELERLHTGTVAGQQVLIYRGKEGWRSYLRDVLRIGGDVYALGAKAATSDTSLGDLFDHFTHELARRNITYHCLYDSEVRGTKYEGHLGDSYRFLPATASSTSTIIILKDRLYYFSDLTLGGFSADTTITVVVNAELAEAQRRWFQVLWEAAK